MVPETSLVIPILVSAVLVFAASFVLHMLLPFHRSDMRKVAQEDELMDALRRLNIAPGDYGVPHPGSMEGMRSPAFIEKVTRGPLALMTISAGAPPSMTRSLVLWFLYAVVVSCFGALIAGGALGPGASYPRVFHVVGLSTFLAYAMALPQHSIWYRRSWVTTIKSMIDGLVYGLVTAGTFGWLWPR